MPYNSPVPDQTFYITTTLPYVNAEPHIGFALEVVAADVIARYQRSLDKQVAFNTGTDEHGQKIYQKAEEAKQTPQEYVDKYATKFHELKDMLNLSYTHFVRTTDEHHVLAAQAFWQRCADNGDIYKKHYQVKYCVGCELEKTDSELEDGRCPLHPNRELELREEENYFFKFSKYQEQLLSLYREKPDFVQPEGKMREIMSFVEGGLQDFSISRLKEKMPWGVEVPGDAEHVMYVWFDALVNYISTIGWPDDTTSFEQYWPVVQLAGKDNLRQQSAMWQAMLMSAEVPQSNKILINGFISVDGQKMSKSLGNVISPAQLVERYGIDATRYLLMHLGPFGTDMDVSWEKFDATYTADLCNGLGNLCSRIAKLCEKTEYSHAISLENEQELIHTITIWEDGETKELTTIFARHMDNYDLKGGLDYLRTELLSVLDGYLADQKPWKLETTEAHRVLEVAVSALVYSALKLQPFMPETADIIINHFTADKITAMKPLFPRLDSK